MSEVVTKAVQKLGEKIESFDSVAKFVITGEGAIMIDEDGVRAGDEDAEVTLTASRETFEGILNGDVNPATAFMMGKLKIDGSMGVAMQLGQKLSAAPACNRHPSISCRTIGRSLPAPSGRRRAMGSACAWRIGPRMRHAAAYCCSPGGPNISRNTPLSPIA